MASSLWKRKGSPVSSKENRYMLRGIVTPAWRKKAGCQATCQVPVLRETPFPTSVLLSIFTIPGSDQKHAFFLCHRKSS